MHSERDPTVLSPDAKSRPTAPAIRAALSGRGPKTAGAAASTGDPSRVGAGARADAPFGEKTKPLPVAGSPLKSDRIQLVAPGGEPLRIGVRTEIGNGVCDSGLSPIFGPAVHLERRGWTMIVTPSPGPVKKRYHGAPLPRLARCARAFLAAGRSAKGLEASPYAMSPYKGGRESSALG